MSNQLTKLKGQIKDFYIVTKIAFIDFNFLPFAVGVTVLPLTISSTESIIIELTATLCITFAVMTFSDLNSKAINDDGKKSLRIDGPIMLAVLLSLLYSIIESEKGVLNIRESADFVSSFFSQKVSKFPTGTHRRLIGLIVTITLLIRAIHLHFKHVYKQHLIDSRAESLNLFEKK